MPDQSKANMRGKSDDLEALRKWKDKGDGLLSARDIKQEGSALDSEVIGDKIAELVSRIGGGNRL